MWKLAHSCLTVCDPMDCMVHGIPQARILEWIAVPFSKGSFLNPGLLHWRQILYLIPGYGSKQTCWLPLLTITMNSSVYHSRKYQEWEKQLYVRWCITFLLAPWYLCPPLPALGLPTSVLDGTGWVRPGLAFYLIQVWAHWLRGDPSDRYSLFKPTKWNCVVRDHEHSKTFGWEFSSHCFTFRKTTLFVLCLQSALLHQRFQSQSLLRVLPDVTNSSSWSDIGYMVSNNRRWWAWYIHDIYVSLCLQILAGSFFFIEVKTTNTQLTAFELETECLEAIHMAVRPNFNNRGHGVWAFLMSSLEKKELSERSRCSVQFSSVTQSCLTLCGPMNRSTPGLPIHHQLQESTQTHVHWVGDTIQPSHPLSSPSPPALNLSQHQGLFKWVSSSHQVAKVL